MPLTSALRDRLMVERGLIRTQTIAFAGGNGLRRSDGKK
jgi:hypothetical protein